MAFCLNCGKEVAKSAKFCGGCGVAVEVTPAPQVPSPPALVPPPTNPKAEDAETWSEPEVPVKQAYAWAMVLLPIIGAVAIAGGISAGPVWMAASVLYLLLFYLDASSNNTELTLLRVILVLVWAPLWLWLRSTALKTTKAPFWAYLFVWILSIASTLPAAKTLIANGPLQFLAGGPPMCGSAEVRETLGRMALGDEIMQGIPPVVASRLRKDVSVTLDMVEAGTLTENGQQRNCQATLQFTPKPSEDLTALTTQSAQTMTMAISMGVVKFAFGSVGESGSSEEPLRRWLTAMGGVDWMTPMLKVMPVTLPSTQSHWDASAKAFRFPVAYEVATLESGGFAVKVPPSTEFGEVRSLAQILALVDALRAPDDAAKAPAATPAPPVAAEPPSPTVTPEPEDRDVATLEQSSAFAVAVVDNPNFRTVTITATRTDPTVRALQSVILNRDQCEAGFYQSAVGTDWLLGPVGRSTGEGFTRTAQKMQMGDVVKINLLSPPCLGGVQEVGLVVATDRDRLRQYRYEIR